MTYFISIYVMYPEMSEYPINFYKQVEWQQYDSNVSNEI